MLMIYYYIFNYSLFLYNDFDIVNICVLCFIIANEIWLVKVYDNVVKNRMPVVPWDIYEIMKNPCAFANFFLASLPLVLRNFSNQCRSPSENSAFLAD